MSVLFEMTLITVIAVSIIGGTIWTALYFIREREQSRFNKNDVKYTDGDNT